jgi:hypothetical protein
VAPAVATRDYQPDRWSDHGLFVLVLGEHETAFLNDLGWLPDPDGAAPDGFDV